MIKRRAVDREREINSINVTKKVSDEEEIDNFGEIGELSDLCADLYTGDQSDHTQ